MESYNIIFCVYACATKPKYNEELRLLRSTWGNPDVLQRYGCRMIVFLGEERTEEWTGDDVVYLPGVGNEYPSAFEKQNYGIRYIHERFQYKYICTCGTDTFINVPLACRFIEETGDNPLIDNVAIVSKNDKEVREFGSLSVTFYSGGPGHFLSYKTVSILYPMLIDTMRMWIQYCISHRRWDMAVACDVYMCHMMTLYGTRYIEHPHMSFFTMKHMGYEKKDWGSILGCHNMKADSMREMWEHIRG